jgi:branched-subunit amino acid aminotransferase/4-amino-4-deoxychorismate lyase
MIVWRDGEFAESRSAIAADDRGWLVGECVFETFLVEDGEPDFLLRHLERLAKGCRIMGLESPLSESEARRAIKAVADKTELRGLGAGRIAVSRVGGARGLAASADARVQTVVAVAPWRAPPSPLRLMISARRRWTGAATNAFKCAGAYAENLLARGEASRAGADEALMLNEHGRVACASAANVFVLDGRRVSTPPPAEGALPGVTRAIVLEECARLGLCAAEEPLAAETIGRATILLTNSLIGVARASLERAEQDDTADQVIAAYKARRRERT